MLDGSTFEELTRKRCGKSNPKEMEKSFMGLLFSGRRGRFVGKVIPRREKSALWDYFLVGCEEEMRESNPKDVKTSLVGRRNVEITVKIP